MKKRVVVLFITLSFVVTSIAQEVNESTFNNLQVDVGYLIQSNKLNEDNYYDFKYSGYNIDNSTLEGLSVKFTMPTKRKYLDIIFGVLIGLGMDDYGSTSWSPGNTDSYDYKINGGGVFAGVSPKLKGKHFGLTCDLAIGVFSYKEYLGIYNNIYEPFIDSYERKASYGLGGLSALGFYVNFGKIGLNPNVNAIFTGGNNTSFLFYGVNIPLTYKF
ncbi:hypothetical protein MNBD_BACTEROID01-369 [hydrothermal vent metagenome]|uniref:Outer membrane protein beta-barrel domain-containing protein n=1 Tax=hydrothermal vent metagenome TaxID=652676 RepID=A0A3B0TWX8_9ZZZZ